MISCPICNEKLIFNEKGGDCLNRHHFDRAKQGYYNLNLNQRKQTGDNKEMVDHRHQFLSQGYYDFLSDEVKGYLKDARNQTIVDLACGEGYYTHQFPHQAIGIDLSKEALKIASRTDKSSTYLVASMAKLPLQNESVDWITKLFAPTFEDEMVRVLKTGGYALLVEGGPKHLLQMKEVLYEVTVENELKLLNNLKLVEEKMISKTTLLKQKDIEHLLAMTPYQYKTPPQAIERLLSLSALEITFEFNIRLYQKTA